MLKGKHIIVGVTGSIAAYKAAMLIRLLVKEGADVRVIMTPLAKEFITPLTLATLSKHPILVEFFDPENGAWNSHVSLGEWADAYVIAPATANTLSKMAAGEADNLLTTTYLSAKCPVFVAPAMDLDMYAHTATQRNLRQLQADGVRLIEPASGELASGLVGKGRMAEPEEIAARLKSFFTPAASKLQGKKVMITVGGTVEKIDAVRFISNYSTGKMGYALARACMDAGAEVTLIRGRVDQPLIGSVAGATEIPALSADEMYDAVQQEAPKADILIMAAAVADFAPLHTVDHKIKKEDTGDRITLCLRKNKDIAASVGATKRPGQLLVGFALESENGERNAQEKLRRKGLDLIVLNSLKDDGAGFGTDTNKVTIFSDKGEQYAFPQKSKREVAEDILSVIEKSL